MQIFYLVKHISVTPPAKNAELYLEDEFNLNHAIVEPLLRIKVFLSNVTFNSQGMIEQLRLRKTKDGKVYYSYMDDYIDSVTGQEVRYEIVKKLNSQEHVYELRFISHVHNINRNCRILFTLNENKVYIVLTHGFTKTRLDDFEKMNQLTNSLAQIAEMIFRNINTHNNDVEYIGKGGSRHEFQIE